MLIGKLDSRELYIYCAANLLCRTSRMPRQFFGGRPKKYFVHHIELPGHVVFMPVAGP